MPKIGNMKFDDVVRKRRKDMNEYAFKKCIVFKQ